MSPRVSGGTRVDMFSNEFRSRLSLITSPFPSSICLSRARIESMLASGPILASTLGQCWGIHGPLSRTSIQVLALDNLGLARAVRSRGSPEETTSRMEGEDREGQSLEVETLDPSQVAGTFGGRCSQRLRPDSSHTKKSSHCALSWTFHVPRLSHQPTTIFLLAVRRGS